MSEIEDFAALLIKHLDGLATPEESEHVWRRAAEDAALRRLAGELCRLHGELLESLPAQKERAAIALRAAARGDAPRKSRREAFLPLAAAGLLLAGLAGLVFFRTSPRELPPGTARSWNFAGLPVGRIPPGFESAVSGRSPSPADWQVRLDGDNAVLAQVDGRSAERFAVAVAGEPSFRNVRVSARIKILSGYQRAGLVWRWRDADHYYVAAFNPWERNVRLDWVEGGRRIEVTERRFESELNRWYTLTVEHAGDAITVFMDGVRVLEARDASFGGPGKAGVWVKNDTVAWFDDFVAEERN